ncbi:hypothetical protein CPLU01_05892 [Colletotrichum plurivorum]|uniref:Uncharacterized protein n=1 Tax=Colletotrichum plurivorum TaxID=2175906 RepID=A0A8H6KL40_9PEZI|nr:hypothetical protein CPLU01_05892 [Colletotrichum plurivorum]
MAETRCQRTEYIDRSTRPRTPKKRRAPGGSNVSQQPLPAKRSQEHTKSAGGHSGRRTKTILPWPGSAVVVTNGRRSHRLARLSPAAVPPSAWPPLGSAWRRGCGDTAANYGLLRRERWEANRRPSIPLSASTRRSPKSSPPVRQDAESLC